MQTARPKHHVEAVFYGLVNAKAFLQAMQLALNQVPAEGVFTGDNLVTFSKNLSFLEDERFMAAFDEHAEDTVENHSSGASTRSAGPPNARFTSRATSSSAALTEAPARESSSITSTSQSTIDRSFSMTGSYWDQRLTPMRKATQTKTGMTTS